MLALRSALSISRPAASATAASALSGSRVLSLGEQERSLYSYTKPVPKSTVDCMTSINPSTLNKSTPPPIPEYLQKVYWWAYLHPNAVWFFERQWLVDAILWGNFKRLRNAALEELATDSSKEEISGKTLQLACVYGDFTQLLAKRLAKDAKLHVVDVAPIQLENLEKKMPSLDKVTLSCHNAADLMGLANDSFDQAILFFLLHEMPANVRTQTLKEVVRVMQPGGKLVLVDYHGPSSGFPLKGVMHFVLSTLEPFALDLWHNPIEKWLPTAECNVESKETYFGGLYQKVVITKKEE